MVSLTHHPAPPVLSPLTKSHQLAVMIIDAITIWGNNHKEFNNNKVCIDAGDDDLFPYISIETKDASEVIYIELSPLNARMLADGLIRLADAAERFQDKQ
jgi:hypothetical protein